MKKIARFDVCRSINSSPVYFKNKPEVIRYFDTINPEKEDKRLAVAEEVGNRISAAGGYHNLPTDFRTSAFDLFNWLQGVSEAGIYRIGMRETYLKILKRIKEYHSKARKQYAAGYFEKPNFLTDGTQDSPAALPLLRG